MYNLNHFYKLTLFIHLFISVVCYRKIVFHWYMLFKDIGVEDMVSRLLMQPMHGAWPSLPNIWFAGANSRYSYAYGH